MQLEDPLYSTSISLPTQMEAGTYYYFIEAIGSFDGLESVSTFSDPIALTFMKYEVNELQGLGTEAEPYLIASLADLEIVRGFIENGYYLVNDHLKLTADITLPQDWRPLGGLIDDPAELITNGASAGYSPEFKGTNVAPFSGILDGDGHTVTVAEGGLPLFAYVRTAEVRNLNIYGKKIASAGLVEKSFIDYGTSGNYWESSIGHTIKLENVTLKSGSSTLLSGFVNGSGSGVNAVNLTNCTVERGVTVGYDGTQNKIGSFVGTFNGEIGNCISYATVKGIDAVGGLAGCKGQAMGHCNLSNSAFLGDVVATGNGAGGIIGKGYVVSSAPATEFVAVRNCYVAANIAGADKVGGIIGDESGSHYYLDRSNEYGLFGSNSIKDNIFYGKITAIGDHVGGIVGYLYHFGKTSGVASNFWLETCGADASVGGFAPVGTEWNEYSSDEPQVVGLDLFASPATAAEFADGTVLAKLNASGTSSRNWIQGERHPVFSGSPVITGLEISGTYKTAYYIGDALDLSGMVFTAVWSNGDRTGIDPADVTVTGYDNTARAVQTLTAAYRNATAAFTVTVLKKPGEGGDAGAPANDTIDVYFTLLGAPVHDSEADGIFYLKKNNNLETWISRKSYTVNLNAKVLDVFDRALAEAGLSYKIRDRNYVWSITRNGVTLEEFTNGPNAGWQYTLNGRYSLLGVNEQFLENGDDIVFHYTDDWSKDSAADIVDPGGARSGGAAAPSDEKKTEKPETEAKSSTVVKDGEATATVDKEAKSGAGERLVVNVAAGGEAVSKITALLPKEVLKAESDGKSEIEIRSEIANVLLPEKAVAALSKSGADVTVKAAKDADGRYTFTVAAGDRTLDKVDGGIKATVPAPEARAGSVAVIVRADGTEEIVKKSCAKDGKFVIPLGGSATVKIVDNAKTFADVPPGAWYEANVAFASARELFGGTGANAFSPDAPMTRGMLVTVLHRLENAPDAGGDLFADVDGGAYYAGAAAWASANGIVTGTGDGNFAPGIGINREQLATILHRYAKALGTDTSAKGELSAFGDVGDASDWAAEALEWAVGAGLMRGRSGSDLAPKGPATRAEVAAMMERFIESLT
ncbi:MAG: S-layer homology domain-containing protein [Clostridiales Family XIII bacterium]|nr:S-layer homology domain-containing protein [Clostridiales Family XIII bacterium]